MRRLLLCLALLASGKSFANNKTLFVNGVYAATYGDIGFDKGDWRGNNYSAVRLKAGIQLIRVDFVSLTFGYEKVGFYDGIIKWSGEHERTKFDYRGPLLELHLFPQGPIGFSFAAMQGEGFSFNNDATTFKFACPTDESCTVYSERSALSVSEYTAYLTAHLAYGLDFFAGAGTRQVTGKPRYDVQDNATQAHNFRPGEAQNWKENHPILLVGLRGSTL